MEMAKRGYKLQEFVAHSGSVNCLSIGKKSCRLFVTGGDDERVNLWSIGNSTSLNNFRGHTSGVDSVAFDKPEVAVISGASNGVIKLWDLEDTKLVRSFNGHASSCTAVEYHPFGEFFASGSIDTNLKIWDIRKKESIHTYEGHTKGITTIRFTPDGRWVVSGGLDNAVKIWDLTAGKLLHDFKYHVGRITSLDFHPLEFLLATGSADKTVKFWDLETFELIGTTRPEATGVKSTTFHPDGKTVFCGLNDGLKVYSWEPVICHDTVDIGWSTLADLCIRDEKLLGCSYYQNSVGIWISDISLIGPYEANSLPKSREDLLQESRLTRIGSHSSSQNLCSMSPDDDIKEIKTIYVDTSGEKSSNLRRSVSSNSLKAVKSSESKEIDNKPATQKRPPSINVHAKSIGQSLNKSYMSPTVSSSDNYQSKDLTKARRETITKGNTGISPKPNLHVRSRSTVTTKLDVEKLSKAVDSLSFDYLKCDLSSPNVSNSRESSKEILPSVTSVADKIAKVPPPPPSQNIRVESADSSKVMKSVKYVNGVAVVEGRTRSLVEKFEKRETINTDETQKPDITPHVIQEPVKATSLISVKDIHTPVIEPESTARFQKVHTPIIEMESITRFQNIHTPVIEPESTARFQKVPTPIIEPEPTTRFQNIHTPVIEPQSTARFQKVPTPIIEPEPTTRFQNIHNPIIEPESTAKFQNVHASIIQPESTARSQNVHKPITEPESTDRFQNVHKPFTEPVSTARFQNAHTPIIQLEPTTTYQNVRKPIMKPESTARFQKVRKPIRERESTARFQNVHTPIIQPESTTRFQNVRKPIREPESTVRFQNVRTPIIQPESTACNEDAITDDLMQNHDLILTTLRSRLSKLQVVRHFWERNDIKGGINALQTLPDHSVQADVVSVLVEKMNIFTLDLFSCLLPILLRLLDSKIERHVTVSLELLLKLVAVFGSSIRSTVSATPPVGVDLHAEQRIECCKKCSNLLQDVQKMLPTLIRKGGIVTKCSLELNLVLQQL